jgi:site-specific DNA recombinase
MNLGYIRVSGIKQAAEGLGLETQERRVRAWCEAQGFVLNEVVRDEAMSGATRDRPGFLSLKRRIEAGGIERLIVYKLDRLSRSLIDLKNFIESTLVPAATALISVTEQVDTSSSTGKLFFNILGSFAEFERDLITERLRGARESKVLMGIKGAGRVYGYAWTGNGKTRSLAPISEEVATIRWLYARFLVLKDVTALADEARRKGKTGRSRRPFARSTVRYILENRFYAGWVSQGAHECRGIHEAAISEEDFRRVQEVLGRSNRHPRPSAGEPPCVKRGKVIRAKRIDVQLSSEIRSD